MNHTLTRAGLAGVLIMLAQSAFAADKPYQYDPQKYAEVKQQQCNGFLHEINLLDRRKKQGVRSWEKSKMEARQAELLKRYDTECQAFRPVH